MPTDTQSYPNKVKKRTPNACQQCRGQKIKCSGSQPCLNCTKRRKVCTFDNSEPTISVSKRYLSNLEKRLAVLERPAHEERIRVRTDDNSSIADHSDHDESALMLLDKRSGDASAGQPDHHATDGIDVTPTPGHPIPGISTRNVRPSTEEVTLTNPLLAGPSNTGFISDPSRGRSIYLGTSSNWAFSRRVLDCAHQFIHNVPLPPDNFALDGDIYSLNWDGSRDVGDDMCVALPPRNEAVYLLQSVQFHTGELYHLFDEEAMMRGLDAFYADQSCYAKTQRLRYAHYLLVMALGKAFVFRSVHRDRPSGVEIFVHAMKLLPDVTQLWQDPFTAAEVYCCAALYLQCADWRYAAYMTIGHAIRTALFQGMHTNLPTEAFDAAQIERGRHIWWTVYILDRELSSLMGLPIQLADENIGAIVPISRSADQALVLDLHIKICRIVARVVSTVYGPDGSLDRRFLTSTRSALTRLAEIAEELKSSSPLGLNDATRSLSRLAATLHLQYHHCIVLTTRPLMFSLFKRRLDILIKKSSSTPTVQGLRVLLEMCADSAEHSINILSALQSRGLLSVFLIFDLESAFSSAVVILMANFIEARLIEDFSRTLEQIYQIFDDLIVKGNLIAYHRKAEIEQLHNMLDNAKIHGPAHVPEIAVTPTYAGPEVTSTSMSDCFGRRDLESPLPIESPFTGWNWQDALSSQQLMNVADFLDGDQSDWFNLEANP